MVKVPLFEPPAVSPQMYEYLQGAPLQLPTLQREEVLAHIATGYSPRETGSLTYRSRGTVRNMQMDIAANLGVENSLSNLAIAAHASGWYDERGADLALGPGPYDSIHLQVGLLLLVDRETEVLALRSAGLNPKSAAAIMGITNKTFKNYQMYIYKKLLGKHEGADRSMHTVIAALWLGGLVELEPVHTTHEPIGNYS
ncbi:MAG TPA: LuxR C-terminal-related transcriptional regulator [Patescibacteria group bacterium]|nr:LuxR C-terminal-related transcriptional regulator [Patescibacteria group bacterium]